MFLSDLNDDDILCILGFLGITDKATSQRVNKRWQRLLRISLSRERVLSTRLDENSRVWSPCPTLRHHANEYNTINVRLSFPELATLVESTFPQLTALNIYGMNIDFNELVKLSELTFWTKSLEHLEIAYCGLWLNLEKFKLVLTKATKLSHLTFEQSQGVSFCHKDVNLLWEQMMGKSPRCSPRKTVHPVAKEPPKEV